MLSKFENDPRFPALVIFAVAAATLAGAWIYQSLGYAPCELCLKQRLAFYVALPLSLAAALAAPVNARAAHFLYALLFLAFLANCGLAIYHSGVEFQWWAGPESCTGAYKAASDMQDFLQELKTVHVVRCDQVSLRVFGLSLAVWNIFISGGLAIAAACGLRAVRAPKKRG